MSREITKNQHVLSYIEARNLRFFQKKATLLWKKASILHEIRDLRWMTATSISDCRKKDVIFRFAMDTLILVSPFGATLPCGCNLVVVNSYTIPRNHKNIVRLGITGLLPGGDHIQATAGLVLIILAPTEIYRFLGRLM